MAAQATIEFRTLGLTSSMQAWRQVTEAAKNGKKVVDESGKAVEDYGKLWRRAAVEVEKAERAARNAATRVSPAMRAVNATVRDVKGELEGMAASLGPVGAGLSRLGPVGLAAGAGISAAVVGLREIVREGAAVEQRLANLSAITGAAGKDLQFYRDQALDMARTTTASATQVVDAMTQIASKKPELLANAQALAEITRQAITLSEASGGALPTATDTLTTALNQFELSADSAARVINVLAAGAKYGAAEIPDMTVALVKAGTEAKGAGLSIEETTGIIQRLAAYGTPMEKIGTSLRNIFLELQSGADNTNPAVVGIFEALRNLEKQQLSITEINKRFGSENVTVAVQLLRNADAAQALTGAITGTDEATQAAATRTNTLEASMVRLGNAWDAFAASVLDSNGPLRETVDLLGLAIAKAGEFGASDTFRLLMAAGTLNPSTFTGEVARIFARRSQAAQDARYAEDQARVAERVASRGYTSTEGASVALASVGEGAAAGYVDPTTGSVPPTEFQQGVEDRALQKALDDQAKAWREFETDRETAIDRWRKKRDEAFKAEDALVLKGAQTVEEAEKRKSELRAFYDGKIAEETARQAKKGASEAAKADRERERSARTAFDVFTKLENQRALEGLTGVAKVTAEERQRFAALEQDLIRAKVGEQTLAEFRTKADAAVNAAAAAEATKLADERGEILLDFERELRDTRLSGEEAIIAAQADRFDDAERRLRELDATQADLDRLQLARAETTAAKVAEFQQQQLEPLRDGIRDVTGELTAGLVGALGFGEKAIDAWATKFLDAIARIAQDLAQALLIRQVAAPIANQLGLGDVFGVGTAALGGTVNQSGPLSGLLQYFGGGASTATTSGSLSTFSLPSASTGGLQIPSTFGIPTVAQRIAFGGLGAGALGAGLSTFALPAAAAGAAGSGLVLPVVNGALVASPGFGAAQASFAASGTAGGTGALSGLASYAGLALALGLGAKGIVDTRNSYSQATLGQQSNLLTVGQGAIIAGATGAGAAIGSVVPGIGTVIGAGVGAAVGAAISDAIGQSVTKGIAESVQMGLTQAQLEQNVSDELMTNPLLLALGGAAHVLASKVLGPAVAPDIEQIFEKLLRQMLGAAGFNTAGLPVGGTGNHGLPELRGDAALAARIAAQSFGAGGQAFFGGRDDRMASLIQGIIARRTKRSGEEPEDVLAEIFVGLNQGRLTRTLRGIREFTGDGSIAEQRQTDYAVEKFARASGLDSLVPLIAEQQRAVGVSGGKAVRASREIVSAGAQALLQPGATRDDFVTAAANGYVQQFAEKATKALSDGILGEALAASVTLDPDEKKALRRAKRRGDTEEVIDIQLGAFLEGAQKLSDILGNPQTAERLDQYADAVFAVSVQTALATKGIAAAADVATAELGPLMQTAENARQLGRDARSRAALVIAGPGFAGQRAQLAELTRLREEQARALDASAILPQAARDLLLGRTTAGPTSFDFGDDLDRAQVEIRAYFDARQSELEASAALERQLGEVLEQTVEAMRQAAEQVSLLLGTFDGAGAANRAYGRAVTATRGLDFSADEIDVVKIQEAAARVGEAINVVGGRFQFLTAATENFEGFSDQIAIAIRGPRALREQLAEVRAEIADLTPAAFAGGAGADDAIARLQQLLPQALQLGGSALGGASFRRLQRELGATADALAGVTSDGADVARGQLETLGAIAEQLEGKSQTALDLSNERLQGVIKQVKEFRDASLTVSFQLAVAAEAQLQKRHDEIKFLLASQLAGQDDEKLAALLTTLDKRMEAFLGRGRAAGGAVQGGYLYPTGEEGLELFRAPRDGYIIPNHQVRRMARAGRVTDEARGDRTPLRLIVNVTVPAGTSPDQAEVLGGRVTDGALRAGQRAGFAMRKVGI